MVNHREGSAPISSRRIQIWGWGMLLGLGCTMATGLWWVAEENEGQQRASHLINHAGDQKGLSERILRLSLQMDRGSADAESAARTRLEQARNEEIAAMAAFQPELLAHVAELDPLIRPFPPEELRRLAAVFLDAAANGDIDAMTAAQRDLAAAMNLTAGALQRLTDLNVEEFWAWLIILAAVNTGFLGVLGWGVVRALTRAHNTIASELEERHQVRQMLELIQTTSTRPELDAILRVYLDRLLPSFEGAVYLFSPSRDVVEPVASWGAFGEMEEVPVQDCWSLRLGKIYGSDGPDSLACPHIACDSRAHWCIPMLADGETLGMFHLRARPDGDPRRFAEHRDRAARLAEGFAVTLANLRLRETLRNQSVRDALTGVFNRRYMEESLTRELRRAARANNPVAVVMLDLDHFKRLNDSFGHSVGDAVLSAFGRFLATKCRAEDIVCRYGGEEFVLIFPDMTAEETAVRMAELRLSWMDAMVDNREGGRATATFSAGVAAFPRDAEGLDELIRAADAALYSAKSRGRDRVFVAQVAVAATSPAGEVLVSA